MGELIRFVAAHEVGHTLGLPHNMGSSSAYPVDSLRSPTFTATHGTAPKHAGQDKANPGSLILSGEMMFRYMGWNEASDLIIKAMEKSISEGNVTYDLARGRKNATTLSSSDFAAFFLSAAMAHFFLERAFFNFSNSVLAGLPDLPFFPFPLANLSRLRSSITLSLSLLDS